MFHNSYDLEDLKLFKIRNRRKLLNMSENEIKNKYGTLTNSLSIQNKFRIILETLKLSKEEFGEYCRQKGLYASVIEH